MGTLTHTATVASAATIHRPALHPRAASQRERPRQPIEMVSACSAALAQTFKRKITRPLQDDPRAPPCERCAIEEQPACGSEYVAPWVEMERPSQPKVAHMDVIQRRLRRKRARDPRGSPVVSTREPRHLRLPNAPSTVSDGEKQRHQPLQWADSNRPGRQPPAHHGVAIRAPPFPPRRPETTRAAVVSPDPHVTQWRPQRPFWMWCQPRPTRYRYNA